jgi:membrane associated rhomboid family serine protease
MRRFALRRFRQDLVLERGGLRHPRSRWLSGTRLTPYSEITHLALSPRQLRIGTSHGLILLPAGAFADPEQPRHLVRELLACIAERPGAQQQLAHMAQVEERYRHPHPLHATRALLVACLVLYVAQWWLGFGLEEVGRFGASLAAAEPWRIVTANFFHATWFPPHLILNGLAILVFGSLLERLLGAASVGFVAALSGLGAMLAAGFAGLEWVVGASGIAMGLVGALVYVELRHPGDVPAPWRLPRHLLLFLLALETVLMWPVAWVATSAHLGGFLGGVLAAGPTTGPGLKGGSAPPWLRAANAGLGLLVLLAFSSAAVEWTRSEADPARRAARLAVWPDASPLLLNNAAWLIATAEAPNEHELEVALGLAQRAVEATGRMDANVLDTLAEVQFRAGRQGDALRTIEEAIALAPAEDYFREQRRRFTGARPFEDRPDPPGLPLPETAPSEPPGRRV